MARRTQYKASDFIDAIPGSGGIISTIAKRVGCDWATANTAIKNQPTVNAAYANECESVLDMAESILLKNIREGDSSDAKWYLTKKGKERGYGDISTVNNTHSGPNGKAIQVEDVGITDEARADRIASILDRARERRNRQTSG